MAADITVTIRLRFFWLTILAIKAAEVLAIVTRRRLIASVRVVSLPRWAHGGRLDVFALPILRFTRG